MQHIDIVDYLLLPVYLFLFYVIVKKRSIKYTDEDLRRFFFTAFFLRMFGSVAYSMMVQYYYGYGDSFTFYVGSNFLRDEIIKDPSNISYFFDSAENVKNWYRFQVGDANYTGYFGVASNLFIMKISAIISFFSFNKYLIISLFFGLFSFAGQWRLFRVFCHINNEQHRKLLAWAVLYTPSIWFWGSGLMKDSVCLGGLGFIIHILYKMFVRKKFSLGDLLFLFLMLYVVFNIKSYIIIILAVSLSTLVFSRIMTPLKHAFIKTLVVLGFLVVTVTIAVVSNFSAQLQILAEESQVQVAYFQHNYEVTREIDETSRAEIKFAAVDASVEGLLAHSPVALFTCLYRPFIWESGKAIIFFASLESMLMLLATLYLLLKMRVIRFFSTIFSNEYILFSFVISVLFAVVIGFTTYNFGTMVRYKIVLMPFYYFMLVSLYTKLMNKKNGVPVSLPSRV
jgi:hypothetical protein